MLKDNIKLRDSTLESGCTEVKKRLIKLDVVVDGCESGPVVCIGGSDLDTSLTRSNCSFFKYALILSRKLTCSSFPLNSSFKASLVVLTMRAPKEIPPNMECKDKFLIKSVVTSPGATVEATRRLFNEKGLLVEECKLRVLYISPSLGQSSNFERPEASSLPNATLQRGNLNDYEVIQRQDRNGIQFGDLFMKGVTVVLVGLIFGYLMLPLIWSLIFMITMLAIKMINKLVSDSVEDWVVKTLLYACIHFFTTLFRRKEKVPERK
ncbi:Vesicle-associated protein 1-3 [Sesamum angolense]|uniref:Vesicle-associated protein 1-3 n=1 Tax=Sesamum angolense TaxID=2727404 RepID=A0AAE1W9Z4_9LAMI|nr:Vesicle-associated protein 1-3 [Sesamum angolense]